MSDKLHQIMQNKPNLRKSKMNVNDDTTKDYENETLGQRGKNKPNSNPIKPDFDFTADNAVYAEKKNICVSDCSIKKYVLYRTSPRALLTRRLMTNKPNQTQFQTDLQKWVITSQKIACIFAKAKI